MPQYTVVTTEPPTPTLPLRCPLCDGWLRYLRSYVSRTLRQPCLTDKIIGLISTAGGAPGVAGGEHYGARRACTTRMGSSVGHSDSTAMAGDPSGRVLNDALAWQLRALGTEVARAAEHCAAGRITSPDAGQAEAALRTGERRRGRAGLGNERDID